MVDSVFLNSGRGCINCSGIWASRHTREIADALAQTAGGGRSRCRRTIPTPAWRRSPCRAWPRRSRRRSTPTCKAPGVTDVTAKHRDGAAVVKQGRADYLLPTVVHCESPDAADREEGIHVPVRHRGRVPGSDRCSKRSARRWSAPRSPATRSSARQLIDAVHIDRLNLGPVPTIQLNWLQPHEGNLIDFLFRARAFQTRIGLTVVKILSITAGAAGMYCGSCSRDNALAVELLARGHDVTLLPLYTPTNTDETNVSREAGALWRHQHLPAAVPARCSARRRASSIGCGTRRG